MDLKNHVALGVGKDGIGMSCDVVKKVVSALHGVLGRCGMGGHVGTECYEDGGIDGSAVIKECPNDLLDELLLLLQERAGCVCQGSIIDGGTVH